LLLPSRYLLPSDLDQLARAGAGGAHALGTLVEAALALAASSAASDVLADHLLELSAESVRTSGLVLHLGGCVEAQADGESFSARATLPSATVEASCFNKSSRLAARNEASQLVLEKAGISSELLQLRRGEGEAQRERAARDRSRAVMRLSGLRGVRADVAAYFHEQGLS